MLEAALGGSKKRILESRDIRELGRARASRRLV
jgi:hypothetical protein